MSISATKYIFDVFIGIDFSGSQYPHQQKKHIVFAELEHGTSIAQMRRGLTRSAVVSYLIDRLRHHDSLGRRVLCGFDYQYSFPRGFWHTLMGLQESWMDMTRVMSEGSSILPPIVEEPKSNARLWAQLVNEKIANQLGIPIGPFWGPNFSQSKDPQFFRFQARPFEEYRLVEKHLHGCKSVFKIGGQGSVGLQSLCGIPCLFRLSSACSEYKIPLHFWPFDGWDCGDNHVVVEWYPAIYNKGSKSDENDARACIEWAKSKDEKGDLSRYFTPSLSITEKVYASFEGWVLGVL